jgi:hypothetical protein
MPLPDNPLALTDWRRITSELYSTVRAASRADELQTWLKWRSRRDKLLKEHQQSPLSADQRLSFHSLTYFAHDPDWRLFGTVDSAVEPRSYVVNLESDGEIKFTRIGRANFEKDDRDLQLDLFWIEGYGGGLFVPFGDQTNGHETFGGGRYLIDTIKGADLGFKEDQIVLDFNYGYNPSCAYNPRWICPLAPSENKLQLPVRAGEKAFK